jgi:acetyl esterase/lipase
VSPRRGKCGLSLCARRLTECHFFMFAPSIPDDQVLPHLDPTSPPLSHSALNSDRAIVYHYALQEALWHDLWFGNTPRQSPGSTVDPADFDITKRLEVACKDRAEVKNLPPIFITSGTKDDKVDPQGTKQMAECMDRLGVQYEWDEREGKDHLFDQDEKEEMEKMHGFLKRWLL